MTSIRASVKPASLAWLVTAFGIQCRAAGAEAPPDHCQSNSPQRHELTGGDLETFLDALVPMQLFRDHIAGAVVVVVKDGKVLLAKGFGYADVETRQPITPSTLFRPGSISKLFTGIAVMQLVEKGKIDLDRDVNDYLDFRIETPPGGVPVTLRRLLTHRAGFEEQIKELFTTDERPRPLGAHLAEHLPARLFSRGRSRLFELRRGAGRVHRGAGLGRAVRPIRHQRNSGSSSIPLTCHRWGHWNGAAFRRPFHARRSPIPALAARTERRAPPPLELSSQRHDGGGLPQQTVDVRARQRCRFGI
jgi:Beta-lactamase